MTAASIMTIVVGALWLLAAGMIVFGSAYIFTLLGNIPRGPGDAQARGAAEGAIFGLTLCCGIPTLLMSILHLVGGVFALQRKEIGRIMVIICASLALILGALSIFAMFRTFFVLGAAPPFEVVLYQIINLIMTLGYGIFAISVMSRGDYADEFE